MTMRTRYMMGQGVRLPDAQWLYRGIIYTVPPGNGAILPRATQPSACEHSRRIFRANQRQLVRLAEAGHVPAASLRIR